jgi:NADH-quinone oxidoreductase subunit H
MGVALSALFTLLILVLGVALTLGLERVVIGGPSVPVPVSPTLPNTDRLLRPVGPFSALLGVTLAAAVIPFGPRLIGSDLTIGVFYFIVVVDFVVLGVALSGWGANTRGAVDSFYRITAQLVSYVVPLGLALVGAIMMARSLSTVSIVGAQRGTWFVFLQPLGFALYLVTGLMQAYRAPFAEAFSPFIGSGVLGVSGRWARWVWRAALAGLLFVVAAMGALLFLGGWLGPVLPGPVWMLLKTLALVALMLWIGRRVKPLSTAQMLALSWRVLIPAGLVNVLLVGGLILLGVGPQ